MTIRARVEYDDRGRATSADIQWAGPNDPGEHASMHYMLERMLLAVPGPPTGQPVDNVNVPPVDDLRQPSGVLCRRYICQHPRDVHNPAGCQACAWPGVCPTYVGLSETVLP